MAKAPASTSLSPRTSNTPTDVFQEIDFTKPFENFSRKVSEPSATQQRLPLVSRTIIDLLPELLQIRNSIPRWRASIEGMPGIDSNAAEQAQRLEDLNYAVERRNGLLQRHRALLTETDAGTTAPDLDHGIPAALSYPENLRR